MISSIYEYFTILYWWDKVVLFSIFKWWDKYSTILYIDYPMIIPW